MKGLFLLKETLQEGDYMCKIDLKDAYFSVPPNFKSQKFLSLKWKNLFYQFLCLCFGLGPAPSIFMKLMRIPISLLRKLYVQLIIFLDDILKGGADTCKGHSDISFSESRFFDKLQTSTQTMSELQFSGMEVNSIEMTLTLSQEKKCLDLLGKSAASTRELSQLTGRLASTAIAVLPVPLQ